MKYLLVLLVVGIGLWALFGRSRRQAEPPPSPRPNKPAKTAEPAPMLACMHCGVHLPREDAMFDAGGRAYCGDAHRLAGPR